MSKNIFEDLAQRYDNDERKEIANSIAIEIKKNLKDTKNKSALDYGSGTGLVGLNLVDDFKEIIFADFSQEMLKILDYKLNNNNIKNAQTLHLDLTNTKELPSFKVDYIIIVQTLLHIKNTKDILSNLYQLLNESGHLIIVDFDKQDNISHPLIHNGFYQEELKLLLSEVGFKSSKSKTFYYGEKIFMKEDASLFIIEATK